MVSTDALLYRVAKRWIAGRDKDSLILDAKRSNAGGMSFMANFLGEDIKDAATADVHAKEYFELQNAISLNKLHGCVSVKLTQLGLGGDEQWLLHRLELLIANAERNDQFFWIDMESSAVTSKTLEIFTATFAKHRNVGIAIQAYLRRTEADLKVLLDNGAHVRLVKGAYREPLDMVFANRSEVSKSYSSLLKMLFERGENFAVGTHDSRLIEEAKQLAGSKHAEFEFQFLKGIRDDLKEDLLKSGYKVSEYLPYGDSWLAYSKRRLSEHPSNFWLLLRSLL